MPTILITSGGTKVYIDDVRHVGNMSSGRFGSAIAEELLRQGHKVIFLHAKGSVRPDRVTVNLREPNPCESILYAMRDDHLMLGIRTSLTMVEYRDFDDYATKLEEYCRLQPDIVMLAAAVSDYGMPTVGGKISSDKDEITFTMAKLPKLITKIKAWCPSTFLVGFKLLVGSTDQTRLEAVSKQIDAAKSDLVVVNDLNDIRQGRHFLWVHDAAGGIVPMDIDIAGHLAWHAVEKAGFPQ